MSWWQKFILNGCTSVNKTDYHLRMNLARILIEKGWQLFGNHLLMSTKYYELLYLVALNYAAERYKSALKYIKLLPYKIDGTSHCEQMIKVGRYFLFIDEVAFVIGLLSLVKCYYSHGGQMKNWTDYDKSTSVYFFRAWIINACQVELNHSSQYEEPDVENNSEFVLTTATEVCLYTLFIYRMRTRKRGNTRAICDITTGPQLESESDIIQVSHSDNFPDLLRKCAVIHLTKFYQSLRMKFKDAKCTKAVSHYKALYWYSQNRYDLVLKLYNDVLQGRKVCIRHCFCFRAGRFVTTISHDAKLSFSFPGVV